MDFNMAAWDWPQWTMVGVYIVVLLIHATLDGRDRTGKYSLSLAILGVATGFGILWAGGYWA